MNQEKIGKFILKLRREKNMTQQELADKIGVTDRAISKWENGRGLPDLSLMIPLCKELGITINELISGEQIEKKDYQSKLEENIFKTIDYTNRKFANKNKILKIVVGTIITIVLIIGLMFFVYVNRGSAAGHAYFAFKGAYGRGGISPWGAGIRNPARLCGNAGFLHYACGVGSAHVAMPNREPCGQGRVGYGALAVWMLYHWRCGIFYGGRMAYGRALHWKSAAAPAACRPPHGRQAQAMAMRSAVYGAVSCGAAHAGVFAAGNHAGCGEWQL